MSVNITINTTGDVFINSAIDSPEPKPIEEKQQSGKYFSSKIMAIRKGDENFPSRWISLHPGDYYNDAIRQAFGSNCRLCRIAYFITEVEG